MEREKIKSIFPHAQAERMIYSIKIGLIGRFKQLVQVRHTIVSVYYKQYRYIKRLYSHNGIRSVEILAGLQSSKCRTQMALKTHSLHVQHVTLLLSFITLRIYTRGDAS